jgi:hypothetical protein
LAIVLIMAPAEAPGKLLAMNRLNSGIPPANSSDDPGGEMPDAS